MKKIILASATALLLLTGINHAYAEKLDAAAIKALFIGKTVTSYHTRKDFDVKAYYDPDGTVYGIRDDSIWQRHWEIRDDGNICIIYKERDKEFCRIIKKIDGKYYKYKVKGNGNEIRVIEYRQFEDGNTENYKWVE